MPPANNENVTSRRVASQSPIEPDAVLSSPVSINGSQRGPIGFRRSRAGWLALAMLSLLAHLLSGCDPSTSFTGGSFPPGGKAVLIGRVVAAENPLMLIPNAAIKVTSTDAAGKAQTMIATTDIDGSFAFYNIPIPLPTGSLAVKVVPQDALTRQAQEIDFSVNNSTTANLIVSLPATSFNVNQNVSLQLTAPPAVAPTNNVSISANLLGPNGQSLGIQPTLLYEGTSGTLGADGTFYAQTEGVGTVKAFWYNGVQTSAVPVSVNQNAQMQPPPAPKVPSGSPLPLLRKLNGVYKK